MDKRSFNNLVIPGWMVFEMHLNYSELRIYALIYSFSQNGEGEYYGSLQYLADWCGLSSPSNAQRVLKSLIEKGLISRYTDTVIGKNGRVKKRQHYRAKVPVEVWGG